MPATSDSSAPTVDRLSVNNDAVETTDPVVSVAIEASDTGGSGVASLYLVEREFNSAARQWVAVQNVGWIAYQSPLPLTLTSRGGTRYIQAWVSDGAGNIRAPRSRRASTISRPPIACSGARCVSIAARWPRDRRSA